MLDVEVDAVDDDDDPFAVLFDEVGVVGIFEAAAAALFDNLKQKMINELNSLANELKKDLDFFTTHE